MPTKAPNVMLGVGEDAGIVHFGTADPLRFGRIEKPLQHHIAEEVISGIAGYGNPLGVPSLDPDSAEGIVELFLKLHIEGVTVIFATQP